MELNFPGTVVKPMGLYIHLSVCYSTDLNKDILPELTKLVGKYKPIETNGDIPDGVIEAGWFLDALLEQKNYNCGPKGELFTWGIIGNYTIGENFINHLKPFFEEQLSRTLGPLIFDHILVFCEREGSHRAECWEFYLKERICMDYGPIIVKHHQLPFCWNQE